MIAWNYVSVILSCLNVKKKLNAISAAPSAYAAAITPKPISNPRTPHFWESAPIATPESPPKKNAIMLRSPTAVERNCGGTTSKSEAWVLTSKKPRNTP